MNTRMYYGRSVGDQAKEQAIPGHANAEPYVLVEGFSTVNIQQQHHSFMPHPTNFDPSTFSNVYCPFVAPVFGPSVSAVPLNYGSLETYGSSYTRKNAEIDVGSSHCGPYESTITSVNTPIDPRYLYYGHPPHYCGGNESLSVADNFNDRSVRVRSVPAGMNFIRTTHYNGYTQGSHGAQYLQPVSPFPFDHTLAGSPVLGLVGWNHPPALPYMHGHRDNNLHQVPQMQGMSDHCFQFFPQDPIPHFPLPNGAINIPVANPISPSPRRYSRQITGGTNRSQIRVIPETMRIHCDIPYLTYVDEVAIIDLPEQCNDRHHSDDHSDMRMDIENMSYEELLALGEHIGNVNTGLSEEIITNQLRTRRYELPSTYTVAEDAQSVGGETIGCIICLGDYENQEELGYLDCGHDYHADCLKKWLLVKNVCPACKTQALLPA